MISGRVPRTTANVAPGKSGYTIGVADNLNAQNRDVLAAAATCNGAATPSRAMFQVNADPLVAGQTGSRFFAADHRGTIYFDNAAAIANPIPAALADFIQ